MKNRDGWNYQVKCPICGKVTGGRLPRAGGHKGNGTWWFPTRHKQNKTDKKYCEGIFMEGEIVNCKSADVNEE